MKKLFLLVFVGLACGPPPPQPGISVTPDAVGLSYAVNPGGTEDVTVTVKNTGDVDFEFTAEIEETCDWLSCPPTVDVSLLAGKSHDFTLTVDYALITDGLNSTVVSITWTQGSARGLRVAVYVAGALDWIVVDGVNGDDDAGAGTAESPYATISKGLTVASGGAADTVVCLPAEYGEKVTLEEGVALVGSGPVGCFIDAGTGPSVVASVDITSATSFSGFRVTGDDPPAGEGAAMTCEGSPVISDCEFVSCQAGGAGAVLFKGDSGATATFSDCVVRYNWGSIGIVCQESCRPRITDSEISDNELSGVACAEGSSPEIEYCEIGWNGGTGVYVLGSAIVTLNANTIRNNAQGITLWGDSDTTITNNVVLKNTGWGQVTGYGLASNLDANATAIVTNNTFVENQVGIWWGSTGWWSFENNIVYYNTDDDPLTVDDQLIYEHDPGVRDYNCIEGYSTGGGPEDEGYPPRFVSRSDGDELLRLRDDSFCVDSGDDGAFGVTASDRAGDPRIVDGDLDSTDTVDRGAYEYQP